MKILHNPACSKSRETLALIRTQGYQPKVQEYLLFPPSKEEVLNIAALLGLRPRDLVRTKEEIFAPLGLDLDDDGVVAEALAIHPILLERPIVLWNGRAALGRPPENVLRLFHKF